MPNVVTVATADSTVDGSGASTTIEPPQLDNGLDDAILLMVNQSLNSSSSVSAINVTTPSGYTLLTDLRDSELRSWVFYKQSTGSETIPSVTSDTSARWSCVTSVVTDVDWANGGVAQHVQSTGNGDMQSQSLTTQATGAASALVCLYAVERRTLIGFRYPQSRAQSVYRGTSQTGTSEGIDNSCGVGSDFTFDRATSWSGPFWDVNGGGDSLAINVEVVTQGNVVPLQVSQFIEQAAPANTLQTTMNWCRDICDSGKHIDGSTLATWTFDGASDVNTASDEITVPAHGMDESMTVRLSEGAGTAPGGLADDTFYYVEPVSADAIRLRSVNEDTDSTSDYYATGTTKRAIVGISSTGSGTMTLTEARMINAGQSTLDILRPNDGSASNVGASSGAYVGDAGYSQNEVATAQRFSSLFDSTDLTLQWTFQVNSNNRIERVSVTFIDEDGDWMSWLLYDPAVSPRSTGQLGYQFQVDKATVQALSAQSSGTFDATRIRYLVLSARGNNVTHQRFGAVNSISSVVNLGGALTLVNGQASGVDEFVELASAYTTAISKPSDLQVTSLIPISIGDGTTDVSFADSEKSIAFPPLADGATSFLNYLDTLGVRINATSGSTVSLSNCQIGASVPFTFDIVADPGATVDVAGNSYVFGTATLDSDLDYARQLFVGGKGVKDNGAQIRNSTFIVNSQLGADNGMLDPLDSSTDIESCAFELASGTTTGHAIKISTPGSYTFTDLTFSGFGADGTATAAVFNDSGGAVSLITDGGTTPTVRNGAGASTTRSVPPNNVSITGLAAGSRVRIYNLTTATEVVNQIVAGTSYSATYAEGTGYSVGDTVQIFVTQTSGATAMLPQVSTVIAAATGWSLLVQQSADAVYNAFAIDGSTVSAFTADYANDQVDVIVAANFTLTDLYAWWSYNLTTAQGIREFFGGLTAVDEANIRIESNVLSVYLDNTTAANIRQLDNRRFYRADGAYPVLDPTSGGGGIDVVWRNTILISSENQALLEQTQLAATAAARSRTI